MLPSMVCLQHKRVTLHGLDTGTVFRNLSGVEKVKTKQNTVYTFEKLFFSGCDCLGGNLLSYGVDIFFSLQK